MSKFAINIAAIAPAPPSIHVENLSTPRRGGLGCHDARQIKLGDLHFRVNERFLYEYDFGDLWQRQVRIEKRLEIEALSLRSFLTVRLHPMSTQAHDEVVRHICAEITATETVFPDTDLRLIYEISGSC